MQSLFKFFKSHYILIIFLAIAIPLSFWLRALMPEETTRDIPIINLPSETGSTIQDDNISRIYNLLFEPSDLDDGWSEGVYYISHYELDDEYEYRTVNSVAARISPVRAGNPWSHRRGAYTHLWAIQQVREHITVEEAERSYNERKELWYPDYVLDRSFFDVDTELESSVQTCRQSIDPPSVWCQALLQHGPYTVDLYISVDSSYITSGDWIDVFQIAERRLITYGQQ